MAYIVTEIQNGAVVATSFDDKANAFEMFFDVARYIPNSELEVHTAMITNDKGQTLFQPITKDIMA